MQTGMEPLVINWTKEEPQMGQIILHIYVYFDNSIFKSICNIFFSQINSTEGAPPNDEFKKKFI